MLNVQIFRMNVRFSSFYFVHVTKEMTFVQKTRTFNVDEIDTNSQFHRHLLAAFAPIFFCQKITKPTVIRENSRKNGMGKMLVKLTPK